MEGKTFYKDDIAQIKGRSMLPSDTLSYIEALEKIANDAYDLWIQLGQPKEKLCADDLYDSLSVVNFMNDEEDE